jgi:hypothetical protein
MRYLYLLTFLFVVVTSYGQTSWIPKGGPLGGQITDVEYFPGTSTVWALANGHVYKSTNDGTSWIRPANAQFNGNSVNDIEITNNTIYFLTYDQLFTSTDQGATIIGGTKGQFFNGLKVKRLPVSGGLVVLTNNGNPDIYFSTNNGVNWTGGFNTSSFMSPYLAVNNVDQVFMIARNASNIYRPFRSVDGGANFNEASTNIPAGDVYSLIASPDGSSIVCVNATGIYTTTNGLSWTAIKGGSITDATIAAFSNANSFVQYTADNAGMYFIDNLNNKLHTKTSAGAANSWTAQATDFPTTKSTIWPAAQVITASSKNFPVSSSSIVFGTSIGIFRSSTGGASIPEANSGIAEVWGFKTVGITNSTLATLLMATNDVGVLRSENSGESWSRVTAVPLSVRTITTCNTGSASNPTQVVLGNNGLCYYSSSFGDTWTPSTQTGTFQDIQGGDNKRVFASTGTSIFYSANAGLNFGATPLTITGTFPTSFFVNDLVVPTTTTAIYLDLQNNTTGNREWYKISLTYNGSNAVTAAVASKIIPPVVGDSSYGANGKLYVYNGSTNQLSVYSGTAFGAAVGVPDGSRFYVASSSGYIFIPVSGSPGKMHMSRDDGATFIQTDLPTGFSSGDIYDITIGTDDYAYLTTYHNRIYQSKTKVVLPPAPTNLTEVARLANVFILKWNDNSSSETAYRVLRSSDGGTNYSVIGVVDDGDICGINFGFSSTGIGYYADKTVVPGTTYKYKLRVINDAGEVESAVLSPAAIPTAIAQTIPDNRSWTAQNTGGTGYPVKAPQVVGVQSLGNGRYSVSDISLGTFSSSTRQGEFFVNGTATVVGATVNSSSSSQVKANGAGTWNGTTTLTLKWLNCSDNTSTETLTLTLRPNDDAPATPVLQAVVVNSNTVELSWGSLLYAKNYILERSTTSAGSGFTQLGTAIAYPATTINDTNVTDGTTYFYRLKARNGNGSPLESAYSTVITVPFKKPNFVISSTTVSSYVASTIGTFWADFDNDGNEDLFTVNGNINGGALATATIFKNLGTGEFEKKALTLAAEEYTFSSASDINNDGKMDISLTISNRGQVDHYLGNGDFTFTKISGNGIGDLDAAVKSERQGVMWGDINNDGRLDLVLSGEYDAQIDDRLSVLVQNVNGSFTSIHAGDLGDFADTSFSTFWIDFNNDGYSDILVSGNDPLLLYKNNGNNTFSKVSSGTSGISLGGFAGLVVADFNNDTFMDIFCGGGEGESSVIYVNDGDGSFTLKDATGVTEQAFVISPAAGDINNDGLVDLIVPGFLGLPTKLFINNSAGSTLSFTPITTEKVNDTRYWHIGAAYADYNKDGFIDLAMASILGSDDENSFADAPNYLFKNNNTTGNWIQVKLKGVTANKNGLGAKITVNAGGKSYTREVVSASAFVSLNSLTQHFGIGSNTSISSIQVRWPADPPFVQTITNPSINSFITITENSDPDAPEFHDMNTLPVSVNKTTLAQTFSVNITDNKGVHDATMFVKSISAGSYTQIAGVAPTSGNAWTFAVPSNAYDGSGIEYYFKAHDAATNEGISPGAPATYKTFVKYDGTSSQIPAGLIGTGGTSSSWKIVAIPFELGGSNGVQTVFDELTGTKKVDYRLVTYTESPAPAWQDYPDVFNTINRGVGYMINIKSPVSIVVGDGLIAPGNTRDNLFKINLKKGWNMIGNPYLDAINWSDVVDYNSVTGAGTTLKRFNAGNYENATSVAAYEGAVVNVEADVQISIPFAGQNNGSRIQAPSFGTDEWLVPITLQQGELKNTFGGVGMHSSALLSFDKFDDLNGPRWFDYLEMKFSHPEYNTKAFARDVVPVANDFIWSFEIASNISGVASMSWDNKTYTIGQDLYLYDEDTQTPVNMKENSSYSFDASVSRNFKVYYGENAYASIKPAKVKLGLAVPNPTTGTATIGFSIPDIRGKMNVRLDVFDLTGRRVGTLANGEFEAGFYSAQWSPQEGNADGMYVYRLFAGDEILGGKFILRK